MSSNENQDYQDLATKEIAHIATACANESISQEQAQENILQIKQEYNLDDEQLKESLEEAIITIPTLVYHSDGNIKNTDQGEAFNNYTPHDKVTSIINNLVSESDIIDDENGIDIYEEDAIEISPDTYLMNVQKTASDIIN